MELSARHVLWRRFEDEQDDIRLAEVCGGVRSITEGDGVEDPHAVVALAIAGAAEGVLAGLDDVWALYTPQQVVCAASALCAQITAAGGALEKLDARFDVMAERGDIAVPDVDRPGSGEAGEPGRLGPAQSALGSTGHAASTAVPAGAEEAVRLLTAAQYLTPLSTSAHETLTEVGRLLGDDAEPFTADHDLDTPAHRARERCGCRTGLTARDGARWDFRREDSEWRLVRRADGHWAELAASETRADPRHLTALIRSAASLPTVRTCPEPSSDDQDHRRCHGAPRRRRAPAPSHGYVNGDARMTSPTKGDGHAVDGATGSGMFP